MFQLMGRILGAPAGEGCPLEVAALAINLAGAPRNAHLMCGQEGSADGLKLLLRKAVKNR